VYDKKMKNSEMTLKVFIFLLGTSLFLGCLPGCFHDQRTITQISSFSTLASGGYDGRIPLEKLLSYGNFGLGTFHGLDGEMIVLDGHVYQVRSDGRVQKPSIETTTTPFASVIHFHKEYDKDLPLDATLEQIKAATESMIPNLDDFCAVKVSGQFKYLKTRSVPIQTKPFPPLEEVLKTQSIFEFRNVEGTMVGFRSPVGAGSIVPAAFHFHFISEDRSFGGHVLEFVAKTAKLEIQRVDQFNLFMPIQKSQAK